MLNRIGAVVASTSLITLGTVGSFSLPNKALVSIGSNLSSGNVDYVGSLADLGKPKAFGLYCPFWWCRW